MTRPSRWMSLTLLLTVLWQSADAADTCYKDDSGRITTRRRAGSVEVPCPSTSAAPSGAAPGPTSNPRELPPAFVGVGPSEQPAPPTPSPVPPPNLLDTQVPVPDRWRIVDDLGYPRHYFNPYQRNVLKGDKPLYGDWFFALNAFSDSVYELRDVASSVGSSSTARPGENDTFGRPRQNFFAETVATELVYYKGDTVFKPPEYEFRLTPVFNFNYLSTGEVQEVNVNPERGRARSDHHVGLQAAFVDKHLRNVSEHYDFDSLRVGIQPFSSDFRGFVFQDDQPGVRLFGTRANNVFQYNIAYFRRLTKDTNSGLNDLGHAPRHDDVLAANLYWQDMPSAGFTSQWTVLYDHDREKNYPYYDKNGALERPAPIGTELGRNYDIVYLGYNGDGHFGRWNLTASVYFAGGSESRGTFITKSDEVRAWFGAMELSRDFDWVRPKLSVLYGSGDRNPFDRKATGFDAIAENPQFAGADSSYWIRQAVPLTGGGGVTLSQRNGVLDDLRAGNNAQSNFTNPGILLVGLGVDMDLLPTLRWSINANNLSMPQPQVIEVARAQGGISHHIGQDISTALVYRPLMSQNIILRASYARLVTGAGYNALFPHSDPNYALFNVLLAY
jgi:hypothetical protein